MHAQEIEFGQWTPDQPDYKNVGLVEACNVYPQARGFGPLETPATSSATTTETVLGASMFFDNSSNAVVFMGSATRLATKRGGTVTETTGLTTAETWQFERFKDLVFAVSIENDPQYLTDIDTDDTWSTLPGTPPKAAQIGRVGDFLVLGDLNDTQGSPTGAVPNRVRWSAFNNPAGNWVTDRGELSDYRDLDPRYGRVTAIVGGRFGLVFQERAVWRMVFVGAPKAFDFELISADRGCIAANSAVTIAADTFFLSQDGFYRTNGSEMAPIGAERVDEWFLENVDSARIAQTHGAVNWTKRCIVWGLRPAGATTFTKQIIYNFALDRWSCASQTLDYFVTNRLSGQTLADLAVLFPSGLGTMSAYTLGHADWQASDLAFSAFVPSGAGSAFADMTGEAAEAEFITGDAEIAPGHRSCITGIRPIVETQAETITTRVRSRETYGGAISTTPPTTPGADRFCPHHKDAWLHSVGMTIPAGTGWDNAVGVLVRAKKTGRR